jgi:hypothetical protein
MLAQISALKVELNRLENVPFEQSNWEQLAREMQARQMQNGELQAAVDADVEANQSTPRWLRFPLATAASVFLVSALGIYLLFATPEVDPISEQYAQTPHVADSGFQLAGLMTRSRDLEQVLRGQGALTLSQATNSGNTPAATVSPTRSEQLVLYRLADIDSQIALLYESDTIDTDKRNQLWAQRVSVLESLILLRGEAQDSFSSARSM